MYAAENSNDKLVELLLGRGADASIVDKDKKKALDYGFLGNNKRVVDLLEGRESLETMYPNNPWEKAKREEPKEEIDKQREEIINIPIIEAKEKEEKNTKEQQLDFSDLKNEENKEMVNEKVAIAVEDPWIEDKKEDVENEEIKVEPSRKEITLEDIKQEEVQNTKTKKLEKEMLDNPWK